MNSFLAKIGWKSLRKVETKIFVSFRSYPSRNTKFQKNSHKIQHIKQIPILQHSWRKQVGKGCEWDKIKIFVPFRSVPSRRAVENSKKRKKIQKIKKYHY